MNKNISLKYHGLMGLYTFIFIFGMLCIGFAIFYGFFLDGFLNPLAIVGLVSGGAVCILFGGFEIERIKQ